MRQHLLICSILIGTAIGCSHPIPQHGPEMISGQAFLKLWEAPLAGPRDPITSLYIRDTTLIAYTAKHSSFWLSAGEGAFLAQQQLAIGGEMVQPPVLLGDNIMVPSLLSVARYTKSGKLVATYPIPTAIQSPATGAGNAMYFAVAHSGSGRLARYNLTDDGLKMVWEMYTSQGIVSGPVVLNDSVFVAGNDGKVFALTGRRDVLWNLPGDSFQTGGKVSADLVVDDYGVYVASQDRQLYCLDRVTGKIRWSYYAPAPLLDAPFVSSSHAYQFVPSLGIVALDKLQGSQSRQPVWVQPLAQQVLSVDETHVYVRAGGSILALDKATGEIVFRSQRTDMTVCATNTKDSTIYAATRNGTILAIKPILTPGKVGEVVFDEHIFQPLAMAGR